MPLTIVYSKIKKRNLVLINNATYQRETLSERPIRQPLTLYFKQWCSFVKPCSTTVYDLKMAVMSASVLFCALSKHLRKRNTVEHICMRAKKMCRHATQRPQDHIDVTANLISYRLYMLTPIYPRTPFWGCPVSIWSQSHWWRLIWLCIRVRHISLQRGMSKF